MTITGTTFDRMRVTPEADAAVYFALSRGLDFVIRPYKNQMNITTSGLNMYVDTGAALVQGRFVEVTEKETLSVPANSKGYLAITIDLTQENTSTGTPGSADYLPINNQVKLQVVDALVQQEMFKDGKIYMLPLVAYSSTGSAITITHPSPTRYHLKKATGSPWKGYYKKNDDPDSGIYAWDCGEFYVLTGYFTLSKQLAAGAVADFCVIPPELEPINMSTERATYTSNRLTNIYIDMKELVIRVGNVYDVTKTGYIAQGPGGWYTMSGIVIAKETGSPIDRNTTMDK